MKLVELLNRASEGYPDEYLREYYDPNTGLQVAGSGDTLAQFIVAELIDTFDSNDSDEAQICRAIAMLELAVSDLNSIIGRLEVVT